MGRSLSLISMKGGVGKTFLTLNLGVILSTTGKNVTILDADLKKPDLASFLDIKVSTSLHDVLKNTASLKDAIYDGPSGVKLVCGSQMLEKIFNANPEQLKEVITNLQSTCDYLLIDTSSGFGRDTIYSISESDLSLLVAVPTISSLYDCIRVNKILKDLDSRPIGFVLNRFKRTAGSTFNEKSIREILEIPLLGVVPENEDVTIAEEFAKPVVTHRPNSPPSQALVKIAQELSRW